MPFGLWTRVGPADHVLDGGTDSGAGSIGHGWARAHPLFINEGHGGAHEGPQMRAAEVK